MAKLIKGKDLNQKQLAEVKEAFKYRWTHEADRSFWENTFSPQEVRVSDREWVKLRAFWFINSGSKLSKLARHGHCVPAHQVATFE